MTIQEELKHIINGLSDEEAQAVIQLIYTLKKSSYPVVEPDEFDLQMIKEYEESSVEDKETIPAEELYAELGIDLWRK